MRAVSSASRPLRIARSRPTSFQLLTGVLCHHRAMYVWVAVRTVLFTAPSAFTSLNSLAHLALEGSGGPGVRNCEGDFSVNGFTAPTHGVGSRMGCPVVGFVCGHQCPGAVLGTHYEGPNRPSSSRAAIITLAAASPAAIPFFSVQPSGMS